MRMPFDIRTHKPTPGIEIPLAIQKCANATGSYNSEHSSRLEKYGDLDGLCNIKDLIGGTIYVTLKGMSQASPILCAHFALITFSGPPKGG